MLLLLHGAVHLLVIIHEVLVVLGLILMLGMVMVVVLSCCSSSTWFLVMLSLVMHLVLPGSLLSVVSPMPRFPS